MGLIVLGCVSKYVKCKNKETFLLELGGYKVPNIKAALKESFIAAKNFLLKIGTVVFVANVIVWALQTFDFSFRVNKQNSMLKSISTFLAPIFAPIGLDNYGVVAALIVGILAKELVISTLAIINGISSSSLGLCVGGGLVTDFSPLTLIVFLVFVALYSPCISYLFGISKTLGKKYAVISFFVMTAGAYIVCMLIYFFGKLYLFSQEAFIWAGVAAIFLIALVFILKSKVKCTYCKNKNCPKCQK